METINQYLITRPGQAVFTTEPPAQKEWIILELVDANDQPMKGERFRVTLPDGTVREGTLDDRGRACLEQIPVAGDCQITFPDLDGAAWERVS